MNIRMLYFPTDDAFWDAFGNLRIILLLLRIIIILLLPLLLLPPAVSRLVLRV